MIYSTGNTSGGTLTTNISSSDTFTEFADGLFEDLDDGKLAFTKTGSGTLTLNNAAHTFSGDTTITSGTLALSRFLLISDTQNVYLVVVQLLMFRDSQAHSPSTMDSLSQGQVQ